MRAVESRTAHLHDLDGRDRARLVCKLIERRIIEDSGCWTMKGAPLHSGHIQLAIGSPNKPPYLRVRAHVFAWEVYNNQSVPAGKVVIHSCDVPSCVNPLHLSVATQKENVADSIKKGRHGRWHATGERLNGRKPNRPQPRLEGVLRPFDAPGVTLEPARTVLLPIRGEVR